MTTAAAAAPAPPGAGPRRMLEVESLSVSFGETRVIENLGFSVSEGETLAVIGPNGSGKTVLFRALIGALPHGGTVRWAPGTRIGYVPQKLDLDRNLPLTGLDFLRAKARVEGARAPAISAALELTGIPAAVAREPIGALSGGQFQRLLLAFALIGDPAVLLFDEPTAGVDEPGEERIYELIHRLQRERRLTVLLISHELSLVYRYATRVLCLGRRRACCGPPTEVLTPAVLEELYGGPVKFHVHDGPV